MLLEARVAGLEFQGLLEVPQGVGGAAAFEIDARDQIVSLRRPGNALDTVEQSLFRGGSGPGRKLDAGQIQVAGFRRRRARSQDIFVQGRGFLVLQREVEFVSQMFGGDGASGVLL